jgi:transmembrane sensor
VKPEPPEERASAHESIEATAAAWLAQCDDGLNPAETAEFEQWRRQDPRHEQAVVRLEKVWRSLAQLRDFKPTAVMHPDRDLLRTKPGRRIILRPAWAELALAAALALAVVWWFRPDPPQSEPQQTRYYTTAGGYERSALPDGSVIELNASTELLTAYGKNERRVQLVRGEAHFTVARATDRPFVVEAGGLEVRALGTAFNVRMHSGQVEVLVTEGRVEVQKESAPLAEPLVAGQQLVWSPAVVATQHKPEVQSVPTEIMREVLAWQRLRLNFANTPLADVITQFNQHNQVQIQLSDPALAPMPIGGSFRPENVEAFVRLLVSEGVVTVERPGANLIVLHPAR